jgi:hypothetical protein
MYCMFCICIFSFVPSPEVSSMNKDIFNRSFLFLHSSFFLNVAPYKSQRGHIFLNETSACEFYIRYIFTITCHQLINNFKLKYSAHMYEIQWIFVDECGAPLSRIGQEYSAKVASSIFQSLKRIQPLPVLI